MIGLIGKYYGRRMCDVGGKLLNGIKSMYVNSLACVRVKGGGSEGFWIDSGVTSPFGFSMCIWIQ